jgi:hypothetical protein
LPCSAREAAWIWYGRLEAAKEEGRREKEEGRREKEGIGEMDMRPLSDVYPLRPLYDALCFTFHVSRFTL